MATISINIPDAMAPRALDAIAATKGWHEGLGITKAQFAKQWIAGLVKEVLIDYEGSF
jgi:hypothetical protein